MPEPRDVHRGTTRLLSTVMVALGVLMVISTLAHGGGPLALGLLLGLLFIAAGAGRLYLLSRTRRS
jgi:amino acid transporter